MFVGISISGRILLNAEALNMAESVGNVTRHRRAPVVMIKDGEVQVVYVPAISGESLAHGYQVMLAKKAKEAGLPVCSCCENGIFLKSNDNNVLKKCGHKVTAKEPSEIEREIISQCVVEDVGGFLYTDKAVKRTSRFKVGYMLPTLDSLKQGAFGNEPELHVRYAGAEQQEGQMLYYVEIGSALYNFTFSIDVSEIGKLSGENAGLGQTLKHLDPQERFKRAEVALNALKRFVDSLIFGAKRSRFNPQWKVVSLQAAVVTDPFEVSPGNDKSYIKETVERLKLLGIKSFVYYFDGENVEEPEGNETVSVEKVNSHTEAVAKASEKALELLKESL